MYSYWGMSRVVRGKQIFFPIETVHEVELRGGEDVLGLCPEARLG